jgi:hypothetical protein
MPWTVTRGMRQLSMGSSAGIAYDVRDGLDRERRGEWDARRTARLGSQASAERHVGPAGEPETTHAAAERSIRLIRAPVSAGRARSAQTSRIIRHPRSSQIASSRRFSRNTASPGSSPGRR